MTRFLIMVVWLFLFFVFGCRLFFFVLFFFLCRGGSFFPFWFFPLSVCPANSSAYFRFYWFRNCKQIFRILIIHTRNVCHLVQFFFAPPSIELNLISTNILSMKLRIHWLYLLQKGKNAPFSQFWWVWSAPSLPLLPGPLWPGVVVPVRVLSIYHVC